MIVVESVFMQIQFTSHSRNASYTMDELCDPRPHFPNHEKKECARGGFLRDSSFVGTCIVPVHSFVTMS